LMERRFIKHGDALSLGSDAGNSSSDRKFSKGFYVVRRGELKIFRKGGSNDVLASLQSGAVFFVSLRRKDQLELCKQSTSKMRLHINVPVTRLSIQMIDVRASATEGYSHGCEFGFVQMEPFLQLLRGPSFADIHKNYNEIVTTEEEARQALVMQQTKHATTQLFASLRNENMATLRSSINSGANIHHQEGATKQTPLHIAMLAGSSFVADAVGTLLQYGANSLAQDVQGRTPMHLACERTWDDSAEAVLAVMLAFSSNPRNLLLYPDFNGNTCLHAAAAKGEIGAVRTLLAAAKEQNPPIVPNEVMNSRGLSPLAFTKFQPIRRLMKPKTNRGGDVR